MTELALKILILGQISWLNKNNILRTFLYLYFDVFDMVHIKCSMKSFNDIFICIGLVEIMVRGFLYILFIC